MTPKETLYFLGNVLTRFQSESMGSESAKRFVAALPNEEHKDWVAWSSLTDTWKPLLETGELFEALPAAAAAPPPMPEAPPREERRRWPRFEMRLRVIVRNRHLTFRTFSKDISLGGLSLESPLPHEIFDEDCQIFIAGPAFEESIRFKLAATGRKDLAHFSFTGLEPAFVEKLQSWITLFEAQLKEQKKNQKAGCAAALSSRRSESLERSINSSFGTQTDR